MPENPNQIESPPLLVLEGQEGNEPAALHGLQIPLAPYADDLIVFWWLIFLAVSIVLLHKLYLAYAARE